MVKISRSWCLRSNLTTEDKDMENLQQGGGGRPPGTGDAKDKRMHSEAGGDDKIKQQQGQFPRWTKLKIVHFSTE